MAPLWGAQGPPQGCQRYGAPFSPVCSAWGCRVLHALPWGLVCAVCTCCVVFVGTRHPLWLDATSVLLRFKCTFYLLTAIWQGFVSFSHALKAYNLAFYIMWYQQSSFSQTYKHNKVIIICFFSHYRFVNVVVMVQKVLLIFCLKFELIFYLYMHRLKPPELIPKSLYNKYYCTSVSM